MKSAPTYGRWLVFCAIACLTGGILIFFLARRPSSPTPVTSQLSQVSRQISPDDSTKLESADVEKKVSSPPQSPEADEHHQRPEPGYPPEPGRRTRCGPRRTPMSGDTDDHAALQEDSILKDAQVLDQKETDPDKNGVFDRITMVKLAEGVDEEQFKAVNRKYGVRIGWLNTYQCWSDVFKKRMVIICNRNNI